MEKSFRLRSDVAIIIMFFFVGLTVFSTVDQWASRRMLLGIEVDWYAEFKMWYNIYIGGMVLFFIFFTLYIVIKEKDEQIATLKLDIIKAVAHMKNKVTINDVLLKIKPGTAMMCKVSEDMITTLETTKAFKEIETKVMTSGFSDISKESILFSDQLLNKYKPQSILNTPPTPREDIVIKKIIVDDKVEKTDVVIGIPNSSELVKEFLEGFDETAKKLTQYFLYFIPLAEPILLEKDAQMLTIEEYEERVQKKGIHSIMILMPDEIDKALDFKETELWDPAIGSENSARIATGSIKFIRSLLPKLPLFVLNDCSLSNSTFWEMKFNEKVLSDSSIVALTFLTYFAIDESEDLRNELQKAKVNLIKTQTALDARKDEIIEEMILSGEMKNRFERNITKSIGDDHLADKLKSIIVALVMVVIIVFIYVLVLV